MKTYTFIWWSDGTHNSFFSNDKLGIAEHIEWKQKRFPSIQIACRTVSDNPYDDTEDPPSPMEQKFRDHALDMGEIEKEWHAIHDEYGDAAPPAFSI